MVFTEEMRKNYTILCPQMSPIHFELLEPALNSCGYHLVVLPNDNKNAVNTGLKYVNNDACYPSLMVVGQIMDALLSGEYDLDKTAVIISQTGGGCRASNYIGFIRRALKKAGYEQIPVISINLSGLESNPGFKLTLPLAMKAVYAVVFGDIFMRCLYRMRPYEKEPGSANAMHEKWVAACIKFLTAPKVSYGKFKKLCREIIEDFDSLPITGDAEAPGRHRRRDPRQIPACSQQLSGGSAGKPREPRLSFPICWTSSSTASTTANFKAEKLGMSKKTARLCNLGIWFLEKVRNTARKEFEKSRHFTPPARIEDTGCHGKRHRFPGQPDR